MTLNRVEQPQVAGGGWAFVVVRKHATPSFLQCFPAAFWQTLALADAKAGLADFL